MKDWMPACPSLLTAEARARAPSRRSRPYPSRFERLPRVIAQRSPHPCLRRGLFSVFTAIHRDVFTATELDSKQQAAYLGRRPSSRPSSRPAWGLDLALGVICESPHLSRLSCDFVALDSGTMGCCLSRHAGDLANLADEHIQSALACKAAGYYRLSETGSMWLQVHRNRTSSFGRATVHSSVPSTSSAYPWTQELFGPRKARWSCPSSREWPPCLISSISRSGTTAPVWAR